MSMPHGENGWGTEDFGGSDYPACARCNDRGWFEVGGIYQTFGVECDCHAGNGSKTLLIGSRPLDAPTAIGHTPTTLSGVAASDRLTNPGAKQGLPAPVPRQRPPASSSEEMNDTPSPSGDARIADDMLRAFAAGTSTSDLSKMARALLDLREKARAVFEHDNGSEARGRALTALEEAARG